MTEGKNASKAVGVTAIMQHCTAMLRDRMTDAASPLTGYTSNLCPFAAAWELLAPPRVQELGDEVGSTRSKVAGQDSCVLSVCHCLAA